MKTKDIPIMLINLQTRMSEKYEKQCLAPDFFIYPSDNNAFAIMLWADKAVMSQTIRIHADTAEELFHQANKKIDDLPSLEDLNLIFFQKKLSELLDLGKDKNIPVDFINPLKTMAKKLASNAITKKQDKPLKTTTLMKPKQE